MQNGLTYHNLEHAGFVREKRKDYSPELSDRITYYLEELKGIETRCLEPDADRDSLQTQVNILNDWMLQACADFEKNVDDSFVIKSAQIGFREKTNDILSKSYAINRTRTWPQGHQGDYYTLEFAYKNSPLSDGIGYYLDRYMLSAPLAAGVRQRIEKLREMLKQELMNRPSAKVLDLACGSCREVFELAPEIKQSEAKFICVDLDEDALNFALDRLAHASLSPEQVELRKYNALRIFDFETAVMEFGLQDVIYSVGYFDYLPDDFLVKLLNSLYKLLAPGGKLIAAFKDADRYRPQLYHWLVNWDGFLQRTEDDFERILQFTEIPAGAATRSRVDSGAIIFYSIEKR